MKVLTCTEPQKLEYSTAERPRLGKGQAVIKIKRVGICGTDLHAFEGTQPFFNYPRILGHELSGQLMEVDGNPGFEAGELVSIIPYFNCGKCIACRMGKPNCCVNMQVCGVHVDGGMVEYLSVRSDSLLHGEGLSLDELALIEPLAIGAHGVRRAAVCPNEFVLIIGAGPIGMGAIEFSRIAGAKVIVLDVNEQRLGFCTKNLKVEYAFNVSAPAVYEKIKEVTNGDMPTVVLDATGSQKAINNAFQYMAHGGRYVLIGLQKGDISFSHPEFHKREGTLMSSRNATRQDFQQVMICLKEGQIKPANYITHRVIFDEAKRQFESWLNPENGVLKAMIEFS